MKIQNQPDDIHAQEKIELEKHKLNLEIQQLKKPWYKKPNFMVPLGDSGL